MQLLDALNWRYATKKMNGQPVPQEKVDKILQAAYLAPTSSGLQPFKIIVITNAELRQKIQPIAYGQRQIVDGSHVLVFAAWDNYTAERIDRVFSHTAAERGLPADTFDDYKNRLKNMYLSRPANANFEHAARQAYIAFGLAIAAAAELRVDATPMEGFDNAALDELLQLPAQGLKSVTILPLGYRDSENDWLVNQKKVRSPKDELFLQIV
ncbi:nitroreductase family protein [Parapedobacter sp. ISTM3]|uniref:Nitroreductase n=1 Tax=Parapedobacter luteus TaxID=623280 RepID=A0A1T5AXX7_9SPHI|nr:MULTISPECIES: nitroreductase family protein [Parapedobacter]MBK1440335.1 nitroreductase family protein [Parapedobacter sp. ISTM3]SKB39637.1 Nitroreductase [Parapedobacter luteus]